MFIKNNNSRYLFSKIIISIIFSLFLLFFYLFFIFPNYGLFKHGEPINNKILFLNNDIKTFKNIKKRYPKNIQELIKYLNEIKDKNKDEHVLNYYKGTIGFSNIKKTPSKEDKYFKEIISKIVLENNSNGYGITTNKSNNDGIILYYVNKELTTYAIYGIEKNGKIYRKNKKIYYLTNQ